MIRLPKNILAICSAAALALLTCSLAIAQNRRFDIPSEDAAKSIPEFARQAGIQIVAPVSQLRGRKTPRVVGTLDERTVLQLLLKGTGLRVVSDTGTTIVLARAKADDTTVAKPKKSAASSATDLLQEVVVTGSHIRGGSGPVGSELMEITRDDMVSQGYSTVDDAIRSLPEQVNAGPNEYTPVFGSAGGTQLASADNTGGTAINLRGLGSNSTLTLIDGHRIAASGPVANYYDISVIPIAAIDRVEILADGASAVYGSDAVGGVVNVILRKDFSGAETSVDYGAADGFWRTTASQVIGHSWGSGHALLTYQYLQQSDLSAQSRNYVRQDLVPFGGSDFRSPYYGEPGTLEVGGNTYAIPPGQSGVGLSGSSLAAGTSNQEDVYPYYDLVPSKVQHSLLFDASQHVTDSLEVFLDATASFRDTVQNEAPFEDVMQVPSSNAYWVSPSPTASSEYVYYIFGNELGPQRAMDDQQDYSATTGMRLDLTRNWSAEVSDTYAAEYLTEDLVGVPNIYNLDTALASSNPATAFNPFGNGTGNGAAVDNAISGYQRYKYRTPTEDLFADANGPIFHLPAGDVLVAVGADVRHEAIGQNSSLYTFTAAPIVPSGLINLGRTVTAEFTELDIPVIGRNADLGWVDSLTFSAAVRHEHYTDEGDTTNPRVGMDLKFAEGVDLRASYGTSFSAPLLIYLEPSTFTGFITTVADPKSPTGESTVIVHSGNDPDLKPETARNWSLGGSWSVPAISGLKLEATYFNIDFTNRISSPANYTVMLEQEGIYSSLITRNPTAAEVDAIEDAPTFGSAPINPSLISAILDDRTENEASQFVDGVDFSALFTRPVAGGSATVTLAGTRMLNDMIALTPNAPQAQFVNNAFYPTAWKTRSGVSWERGGYALAAYVNWQNAYKFITSTGTETVGSFTTVDMSLNVDLSEALGERFHGAKLTLAVQNLLNQDPPFINVAGGYDAINANALGRFLNARVTYDW